jgi:transcriptional regulator of PTS gene
MVETEAWHYLSVRISRGEIHLALRDLSSKLVVEEQLELALQHEQPFLTRVVEHIDQFFIRHQKKLERLTAIAVTMPGIIDTENGMIHRMPFYEEVKDLPLGEVLANHTGVRSIFSTISAPGRWRNRCLAPPAGRGMSFRW